MPIYEYEPREPGAGCPKCSPRMQTLQGISDDALTECDHCGAAIKRVVSRPLFRMAGGVTPESAAAKGFTTFKKAGVGHWEKVAGPGVDGIVASEADIAAAKTPAKKVIDLDSD